MYNTIKLEKGLYGIAGKTFSQALEDMDKSESYESTELCGLDAFERQLKRFDIKISGANSDTVEKFFTTTQSAVLFPEFVRRAIKQGLEEGSLIPTAVSAQTKINGVDYRGLVLTEAGTNSAISEGGALPITTITLASNSATVSKMGRKISASYEAIRTQRLDVFAIALKAIGVKLSQALNVKIITALLSGSDTVEAEGTTLKYSDLLSLWASFGDRRMTTIFVNPVTMAELLKFEQLENAVYDAESNGIKTPFGALLVKTTAIAENSLLAIDNSCALEMINSTDVIIDADKLISTQMEDIAVSVAVGFAKIIPEATKVLAII